MLIVLPPQEHRRTERLSFKSRRKDVLDTAVAVAVSPASAFSSLVTAIVEVDLEAILETVNVHTTPSPFVMCDNWRHNAWYVGNG